MAWEELFSDSFEGTPPQGWGAWSGFAQAPEYYGLFTTDEVAPPTGGGNYVLCQHWNTSDPLGGQTDWPYFNFPDALVYGDIVEVEYYLRLHANFSNNGTIVKNMVWRAGNNNEFYVDSHDEFTGAMFATFQQTTDQGVTFRMYPNINGGDYIMPNGEWVHFRWQVKVSNQAVPDPHDGYLYGWVNGVKRWEYEGIYTINQASDQYSQINLNSTFNNPILEGDDQKRYWDLFAIRKWVPDSASMMEFIGSSSADSNTISLPGGWADGDLGILFAYRDSVNTVGSLPTGWTNLQSADGANSNSLRVAYRVMQTGDTTFSITGTGMHWEVVVLRGQHATTPIGGNSANSGGSGNAITYPTLTLSVADGTSWIVSGCGHRSATDVLSQSAGTMTNRSTGQTVTRMASHTKAVTSWSGQAFDGVVNASSGWRAHSVEVLAAPEPPAAVEEEEPSRRKRN